jgi:hypothetical protein
MIKFTSSGFIFYSLTKLYICSKIGLHFSKICSSFISSVLTSWFFTCKSTYDWVVTEPFAALFFFCRNFLGTLTLFWLNFTNISILKRYQIIFLYIFIVLILYFLIFLIRVYNHLFGRFFSGFSRSIHDEQNLGQKNLI